MFENWLADQTDDAELAKNHAYLLGSFWNPEAVKKLSGNDANTHISTDEDLEKSMAMVKNGNIIENNEVSPKKRKRRKILV